MQARFIMILHAKGYNSLSHLTLHCKLLNTNVSKFELVNPISNQFGNILIPYFIGQIFVTSLAKLAFVYKPQ